MSFMSFAKPVSGIIISLGVGAVVQNAVKATTPLEQKLLARIGVKIGSTVLSGLVADHAVRYSYEQMDVYANMFREAADKIQNAAQEEDTIPGEVVDEEK